MIAPTPGSRSAQMTGATLVPRVALEAVLQWLILTGIFSVMASMSGQAFWSQFTTGLRSLDALIATVLVLAAQYIRGRSGQLQGPSWPWVILAFAIGLAANILFGAATIFNTAGTVAAIVYIRLFTRWFTRTPDHSGDQ